MLEEKMTIVGGSRCLQYSECHDALNQYSMAARIFDPQRMLVAFRTAVLLAPIMMATACTAVYSKYPVGISPAEADPRRWDGVWMCEDPAFNELQGPYLINVTDRHNGVMQIASVIHEEEAFKFYSATLQIMTGGGESPKLSYISMIGSPCLWTEDEEQKEKYCPANYYSWWAAQWVAPDRIDLWWPDPRAFMAAADEKDIDATYWSKGSDKVVKVNEKATDLVDLLEANPDTFIDFNNPLSCSRVAGLLGP